MGISLDKIEAKAPGLLSLAKKANVALDKSSIGGQKAKVALVLDYSGSMNRQYKSGAMQRLAEKVLALGSQLDDDGAIDLFVFDTTATYLGEITIEDYKGSIDRLIGKRRMGTTDYAGAFYAVRDHFGFGSVAAPVKSRFSFKKASPSSNAEPANEPVFAIFLTDGAPNSKPDAIRALTDISANPVFWKFLSVGSADFSFLQKLDDLPNRHIDNADYKPVNDVDTIDDAALFELLLDEYPSYLKEARQKGMII